MTPPEAVQIPSTPEQQLAERREQFRQAKESKEASSDDYNRRVQAFKTKILRSFRDAQLKSQLAESQQQLIEDQQQLIGLQDKQIGSLLDDLKVRLGALETNQAVLSIIHEEAERTEAHEVSRLLGSWVIAHEEHTEDFRARCGVWEEALKQAAIPPVKHGREGVNDMLNSQEAAEALEITVDTLYQRISRAQRKGIKTPFERVPSRGRGELRVRRSDLIKWAASTHRPTHSRTS
jgi:hypothetical protein